MQEQQTPVEKTKQEQAIEVLDEIGYEGFVRSLFNRTGQHSADFTHAVLGLTTEVYELAQARDAVNAVEEFGDLFFYMIALSVVIQDAYPELPKASSRAELDAAHAALVERFPGLVTLPKAQALELALCELQDMAKRWIGYGKAPSLPPLQILMLSGFVLAVVQRSTAFDEALEDEDEVIEANVAKLIERYKGIKFNADHAVNRDTGKEREVLNASVGSAS